MKPHYVNTIWGYPISQDVQSQSTIHQINDWIGSLDLHTLCFDDAFTFSHCRTSLTNPQNTTVDYTTILNIVQRQFNTYLQSLSPLVELNIELEHPWINSYGWKGFQDCHDHQGSNQSDFSWCYVHEPAKSHLVFKNRNATASDMSLQDLLGHYSEHFDYVPSRIVKGTLYIFPSSTLHAVSPNLSPDDQRVTISGNIRVRPL